MQNNKEKSERERGKKMNKLSANRGKQSKVTQPLMSVLQCYTMMKQSYLEMNHTTTCMFLSLCFAALDQE